MTQTAAQAAGSTVAIPVMAADSTLSFTGSDISFSSVLSQVIDHVDNQQKSADNKQQAIDMGQSDDLAGAMIESQKASVSFDAMVQVRNKLAAALEEVTNLPI